MQGPWIQRAGCLQWEREPAADPDPVSVAGVLTCGRESLLFVSLGPLYPNNGPVPLHHPRAASVSTSLSLDGRSLLVTSSVLNIDSFPETYSTCQDPGRSSGS